MLALEGLALRAQAALHMMGLGVLIIAVQGERATTDRVAPNIMVKEATLTMGLVARDIQVQAVNRMMTQAGLPISARAVLVTPVPVGLVTPALVAQVKTAPAHAGSA